MKIKFIPCSLLIWCVFLQLPAFAEDDESRLIVHGFLTQAYGSTNGNTIFGIPRGGTADYRNAALQVRYAISEHDKVVVQLSHERFGQSKLAEIQDAVEVDWAFYQHDFSNDTWIKGGKVQIPIGIYNEIRDVGTVLPFYRPSPNVYGDHTYTSETVDGVVGFHRFLKGDAWQLEVSPYFGGWDYVEDDQQKIGVARVKRAIGVQLWVNTPIDGLRFGIHRGWQHVEGGLLRPEPGKSEKFTVWYLSADASFEKFFFRSELQYQTFFYGYWQAFYAQAGYSLTDKIRLTAQYDTGKIRIDIRPYFFADEEWDRDFALGLNYSFRPNLVAKVEIHKNRGKYSSDPVAYLAFDPGLKTSYAIASISASF